MSDETISTLRTDYLADLELRCTRNHLLNTRKVTGDLVQYVGPDLPADQLTPEAFKKFIHSLADANTAKTVRDKRIRCLTMLRWSVAEERFPADLLLRLDLVKPPRHTTGGQHRRRRNLTAPEVEKVIHSVYATDELRTILRLLMLTGCRVGEIIKLDIRHVEVADGEWYFVPPAHKNSWRGHERAIPLVGSAKQVIHHWQQRSGRREQLFRYTASGSLQAIHRICRLEGIEPFGPHDIRKLVATETEKRLGLSAAAAMLGHKSERVTRDHYSNAARHVATQAARAMQQ